MTTLSGLIIFTDGSSKGNPGPGGFGAVSIDTINNIVVEYGSGRKLTTNNEMELMALIKALQGSIGYKGNVHIYADSQYVYNGATKWIYGWRSNGWVKKDGEAISHEKLWRTLSDIIDKYRGNKCTFVWHHVPSHIGIAGNERVDTIATAFADGAKVKLYNGSLQKYKYQEVLDIPSDEILIRARKEKRARSSGGSAFYISVVNGKLEKHTIWALCEKRVCGVKGAKYRKVASDEEMSRVLKQWGL